MLTFQWFATSSMLASGFTFVPPMTACYLPRLLATSHGYPLSPKTTEYHILHCMSMVITALGVKLICLPVLGRFLALKLQLQPTRLYSICIKAIGTGRHAAPALAGRPVHSR